MQDGATDAAAVAVPERGRDPAAPVDVGDAGDPVAGRVDAEVGQVRDRTGHQPLAARLVDRAGPRLADHDLEAGAGGVQRGGQADRAAAGDDEVQARAATVGSVAQGGVLGPDPDREQAGVEHREHQPR